MRRKTYTLWYSFDMSEYFNEKPIEITIEGAKVVYNIAFENNTDHSLAWPDSKIVATNVDLGD